MSCSIQNNRKVNMENISASNYTNEDYVYLDNNNQHFLLDEKENNTDNNIINNMVNNADTLNNMDILSNNRVITTSEPINLLDNEADDEADEVVTTVKKNKLINYIVIGIILVSIIRYLLHNKPSEPPSYLYSSSTTI
jgi:hypothetical protein